jgi:hypothetical protein
MPVAIKGEIAAEKAERLEECFGLRPEQVNAAHCWAHDTLNLTIAMAARDGTGRHVGRALSNLRALGFVEIKANGREAVARLTLDGFRALVLRLRRPILRRRE